MNTSIRLALVVLLSLAAGCAPLSRGDIFPDGDALASDASTDARARPADASDGSRADGATLADAPDGRVPADRAMVPVDAQDAGASMAEAAAPVDATEAADVLADAGLRLDTVDAPEAALDAPPSDVPCGALELRCGDACVDSRRDPAHCGACGQRCAAGGNATAACQSGACVLVCPAGWTDCDGDAANGCETDTVADHENCGGCGRSCGSGGACLAGRCNACPSGTTRWCSGHGCTNTLNGDPANCGGCGMACPTGAICQNNGCTYARCDDGVTRGAGTWRVCGPECVNFDANPAHCGGCGEACPAERPLCTTSGCVAR